MEFAPVGKTGLSVTFREDWSSAALSLDTASRALWTLLGHRPVVWFMRPVRKGVGSWVVLAIKWRNVSLSDLTPGGETEGDR